ncbi:MAG: ATP-binding protein [Cyanobacteria bacterium P01_C01_bin.89]
MAINTHAMTFIEQLKHWFETFIFSANTSYMPHGNCYLWQTPLVQLHVVSDTLIAIAYFSIPVMLVYFAYQQRKMLPFSLFAMFGGFILLCGIGHLLEIWTLWHPAYWLSGVEQALTALISCYTAASLFTLLPQFLALRTPEELAAVNAQLQVEVSQRQAIAVELEAMNQRLEELVAERTQELEDKNEDLKQAQTQLVQSEKMAALGKMVGGIAHEINNPLSFIRGNLNPTEEYAQSIFSALALYEEQCPEPDDYVAAALEELDLPFIRQDLPKIVESMKVGVRRIQQIVASLRNFSRLDETGAKEADIHEGLDSSVEMLSARIMAASSTQSVDLQKSYGQEIPAFECYPGPLNQVFFNLLSNGIEAIEERLASGDKFAPVLRIETQLLRGGRSGEMEVAGEDSSPSQNYVQVRFLDNGQGIADAVQELMFDPFFTTKPVGQGTGLGLSQAYKVVVEQHRGKLLYELREPDLKVFTVQLPVSIAEASDAAEAPNAVESQDPLCLT